MPQLKQTDFQKFIVESLKMDAEFVAFCQDKLGTQLTYYRGSEYRALETRPSLSALTFIKSDEQGKPLEFTQQVQIVINGDAEPVEGVDGIFYFPANDLIDEISSLVVERLNCLISEGIGENYGILLSDSNEVLSEAGESDYQRSLITLIFTQDKNL